MQKLTTKFALLLMICLSGCQSIPKEMIVTQRFVDLHIENVDGKEVINPDLSFCLLREYKYSVDYIGPISKFKSFPLKECHKINGMSAKDYTAVFEFQDAIRKEILNHEQGI